MLVSITNHEVDGSSDIVNMFDGGHVKHGGEGLAGGVAPVIVQPRLIVGPVRDVSDAGHTREEVGGHLTLLYNKTSHAKQSTY